MASPNASRVGAAICAESDERATADRVWKTNKTPTELTRRHLSPRTTITTCNNFTNALQRSVYRRNARLEMEAAREAATTRDAAAVQRQRDKNIKKRDEERAKRLAGEKTKKTRLAAEARVRSSCSRVLHTLTILPLTQSLCWRVRHASSRTNSPPTAARRRPSAASVRVAPAPPRLRWHASNACSRSHRVFAAEKRKGRIQQKEAERARRSLTENEHAAPKAQCALRPRL